MGGVACRTREEMKNGGWISDGNLKGKCHRVEYMVRMCGVWWCGWDTVDLIYGPVLRPCGQADRTSGVGKEVNFLNSWLKISNWRIIFRWITFICVELVKHSGYYTNHFFKNYLHFLYLFLQTSLVYTNLYAPILCTLLISSLN